MAAASSLDSHALERVRRLLRPPPKPNASMSALAAAAFAAIAAMALATLVIFTPLSEQTRNSALNAPGAQTR
jgi:hypothetical protein